MKTANKTLIAALALTAICFCSCDVLDQPYYPGYEATAFTTPAQVRSSAVGMYNAMQNLNFLGGRVQVYVDVRSNDTNPSTYFGGISNYNIDLSSTDATVGDAYRAAYRTIGEINLFIEKLTDAPNVMPTSDEWAMYMNEAKFLRAVVYFYALNLWSDQHTSAPKGLGVPWIDHSFDGKSAFSDEAIVARASTTEVYKNIIDDLTAATALPATRGSGGASLYFATSGAAWAMLSRVHLYMGNNDAAITAASKVTGYELDADPAKTMFIKSPTSSREIIFWIAHNASDNPGTNASLGQHYGQGGRADISVSEEYRALLDPDKDLRYKLLFYHQSKAQWFCNKYPNINENWAPVIRYGEVVLNEAEARAKQATGVDETAITLVNKIRTRAGVDQVALADFADKAALVEFIITERRRELAFEGHGSFDLLRNGKGIPAGRGTALAPAIAYPGDRFALPIPDREITKGQGVVIQNPGY